MRLILALTLILTGAAAASSQQQQVRPQTLYAAAGIGVEGITVGHSTKSSVAAKYGDKYDLVEHNKYSYEMNYEEYGLSFWYRYSDPEQKIFAIAVKPNSRGFTSRGIVVGRSTLKDVLDAYGKTEFGTTTAEETWFAEYSELGIAFHVEYKSSDTGKDFKQVKLLKRKIIEIEILQIEVKEPK